MRRFDAEKFSCVLPLKRVKNVSLKYILVFFLFPFFSIAGNIPFPVGERLTYSISWGFIPVAQTSTWIEWVEEDGRRLLAIRATTKSNNFLKHFYPVNDFLETILDPETLLPLRFTKRLNEGRYHTDEVTVFDHMKGEAHWKSNQSGKEKKYKIKENTLDLLSFLLHMRKETFKEEQVLKKEVMADEKLYDLTIYFQKVEKIKLSNWGKVKSLKARPEAQFQGLFVRRGKMNVWVSNDTRQIMTKMVVDTPFANVKLRLKEVIGGPEDFWITENKKSASKRPK